MNPDKAVPPRPDENLVAALLLKAERVVLVSGSQVPGGAVDRTRALLASSGRNVQSVRTAEFTPAGVEGAVVALFVRPDQTPELARRAAEGGAAAVWLGPGLVSAEACEATKATGVPYVEDRDLKLEFEVHVLGAPRRDFVPM